MHVLRRLPPSPEQIAIIRRVQTGISLIRGAAGSGKTTTALLSLRAATGATVNQLRSSGTLPANVLVLTYNNSLRSYISAVAEGEMGDYAEDVQLFISTFDKWALDTLGWPRIHQLEAAKSKLTSLANSFPRDLRFVLDEVDYLLGRFPLEQLGEYVGCERTGRGAAPPMNAGIRERLLTEIVRPYLEWKRATGSQDFHDLARAMAQSEPTFVYDVIVIDEAQDLSANQLRAVMRHAAADATISIVTDSTQRIYPRGAPWNEAGITIASSRSFRLNINYRNTRQIAALAASIARGLRVDDDGSLPDPTKCHRDGPTPILINGLFRQQVAYAIQQIKSIDLTRETVGFLHLKGGGFFEYIRSELRNNGLDFCELQGAVTWPENDTNIGLSTLHSAKGLEFDHVFMIGLAAAHASYGKEPNDDRYDAHRRLFAMGIGRARKTVVLGTKPGEDLPVLKTIDPSAIRVINL